ncbi:conserved protein of unknown function [Ralstonia solanacearum CMR15]|nr:conserved protein of unknown function [Ralstonia solanacearum CMR15]
MESPTPQEIVSERQRADLTQSAAAALLYKTTRVWQMWEAGDRRMDPALWELFQMKINRSVN